MTLATEQPSYQVNCLWRSDGHRSVLGRGTEENRTEEPPSGQVPRREGLFSLRIRFQRRQLGALDKVPNGGNALLISIKWSTWPT